MTRATINVRMNHKSRTTSFPRTLHVQLKLEESKKESTATEESQDFSTPLNPLCATRNKKVVASYRIESSCSKMVQCVHREADNVAP